MTQMKTPWDLDVRVRERNLTKGILTPADVEKYLKDLPDVSARADGIELPQPAVAGDAEDED